MIFFLDLFLLFWFFVFDFLLSCYWFFIFSWFILDFLIFCFWFFWFFWFFWKGVRDFFEWFTPWFSRPFGGLFLKYANENSSALELRVMSWAFLGHRKISHVQSSILFLTFSEDSCQVISFCILTWEDCTFCALQYQGKAFHLGKRFPTVKYRTTKRPISLWRRGLQELR